MKQQTCVIRNDRIIVALEAANKAPFVLPCPREGRPATVEIPMELAKDFEAQSAEMQAQDRLTRKSLGIDISFSSVTVRCVGMVRVPHYGQIAVYSDAQYKSILDFIIMPKVKRAMERLMYDMCHPGTRKDSRTRHEKGG